MPFGTFWQRSLLNSAVGGAAFTPPATLYIGLSHTSTPVAAGTGVTEPVGNGYARAAVTNNTTNWPTIASGAGAKSNATVINFPPATGAAWGGGGAPNMTYVVVYNDPTGTAETNFLGFGALTVPKPVLPGDTASFAINDLDWSLT